MSKELLKLKKEKRIEYWLSHIAKWNKSGLSQAEYCRQNNLGSQHFSKWKKKLDKKSIELKPKEFVELKIPGVNEEKELEIVVSDVYKIKLNHDFDESFVKRVLKVLENKTK